MAGLRSRVYPPCKKQKPTGNHFSASGSSPGWTYRAGVLTANQVLHFDIAKYRWTKLVGNAPPAARRGNGGKLNGVLARIWGHSHSDSSANGAEFDARFSPLSRRYRYRINIGTPDYDTALHIPSSQTSGCGQDGTEYRTSPDCMTSVHSANLVPGHYHPYPAEL